MINPITTKCSQREFSQKPKNRTFFHRSILQKAKGKKRERVRKEKEIKKQIIKTKMRVSLFSQHTCMFLQP